jgi:membrane-bound ClpP family serine protease
METVLGLIGMVIFIVGTISLAAGVTYAIVRISPTKRREKGSAAKPAA